MISLPAGWKEVRLGDLGSFSKGAGIKKDDVGSAGVPCVRYGQLYTEHDSVIRSIRSFVSTEVASTSRPLVVGEILFAGSGETKAEIGKCVAYVDGIGAVAGGDLVILTPKLCSSIFLGYALNSPEVVRQKMARAQGDAVVHISAASLATVLVSLPPLKEQEAIAEALSDADAAIESLDALIAKKREVKQATMQQLLTGRTRLPGFTADWKVVRLGEVGSLRGGTGFPLRFQGRKSGEVPFYKVSDMNLPGNEIRMHDSNNWILEGDSRVLGAAPFPKGSIVFAKVGAAVFLERKRILTRPSCIDNNMMAIIPDASWTDVRFLHCALQMVRFGDLVSATALPSINASGVAGISLAMPALKEQEAIAEALTVMDDELEALTEQVSKLRMIKEGMMQDLLTGKVRLV